MKDNSWNNEQFHSISWSAYHQAIKKIPRSHRISISKLSHQLWNTNCQNQKYYGESNLCPICNVTPESIDHLYKCEHPSAVANFQDKLASFKRSLRLKTPNEIVEHIITGNTHWHSNFTPRSPTIGSRLPALQKLNQAFEAQSELGWAAFLRDRISSCWLAAYREIYRPKKTSNSKRINISYGMVGFISYSAFVEAQ
jgi:hypothetical protein